MPLVLIVGFAGILAIVAAVALVLDDRADVIEGANRDNSNVARLVGFHVSHVLNTGSLLLDDVADSVRSHGLGYFRSEEGKRLLLQRSRDFPELQAMLLMDGHGALVVASTLPYPPPSINYADRDYFRRHLAGEDIVVGEEIVSRSLGRRGSTISRAVRSNRGELEAVVLITVESAHFTRLFEGIQHSANDAIAVLRTDGAIFVRLPEVEIGRRFPQAEVFARAAVARSGNFQAESALDGIRRLFSFEMIEGYPLVVVASQSTGAVLAPWWRFTAIVAGGLAVALALLAAASVYAFRSAARNESLQAELERQAHTDSLTGLANRRHFMDLAEKELSRTLRYGGSLAVLMVDLDHFKHINDTYGHNTGDLVLQSVAELFRRELRSIDCVGRLGGEEFAVLLPQSDSTGAREVAERLRKAIADTGVAREQGLPVHFTASIGLAAMPGAATNIDSLLSQADGALYEAKRSGRNRTAGM
jgi:diguanylate cyclase (GGDEF)-like protein